MRIRGQKFPRFAAPRFLPLVLLGVIALGQTSCLFMHSHYLLFYSYSLDGGERVRVEGSDRMHGTTADDTVQLFWDETRTQRVSERFAFSATIHNLSDDLIEITGVQLGTGDDSYDGVMKTTGVSPASIEANSERSVDYVFDVEVGKLEMNLVVVLSYKKAGEPNVFEMCMTGHGH